MSSNGDWQGYGPGWDKLRRKTLERDDYTCQRCGYHKDSTDRSVPLQAHHIKPRSEGGADSLNNLITLCRSCHGVQHPDNEAFNDDRPKAPLFPHSNANEAVDQMWSDDYNKCSRCCFEFDPDELAAIPKKELSDADKPHTVCKPCAGIILEASDLELDNLFGQTKLSKSETHGEKTQSHPLPTFRSEDPVSLSRAPANYVESVFTKIPLLRTYGSVIIFVLTAIAMQLFIGPEYFALYAEGGDEGNAAIASWVTACFVAPIIRWNGIGLVYRLFSILDPTHESSHYTPSFGEATIKSFAGIILAFYYTIGLLIIMTLLVFALGLLAVILSAIS